jgi:hypothetical protein
MRFPQFVAVLLPALVLTACGAGPAARSADQITTTLASTSTTLNALRANNTSAASGFPTQSNGNLGANNVSKQDIHSLLYSGAKTKVLAHLMLWFGKPNHMNVGYSSDDPAQVQRQITDMISRGIDGVIIDWYGPNNFVDRATQVVVREAEKHPGFTFTIMVDRAAIGDYACSSCSAQQKLIELLKYVEQTYFPSSAYLTINGQPVVTNFDIDSDYSIDWASVSGHLATPPRFMFQNQGGFTHSMSDGSYSWVMPNAANFGLDYLSSFYDAGFSVANKETIGAAYKGFNDALAAWGSGRFMNQQCGETWLQTFEKVNSLYGSGKQLPYMQLVTWNDYEEGTEIESGIDSCFSLKASVAGNKLEWSTNGSEKTIDHYEVYSSKDGQNLTKIAEVSSGQHSVDLCGAGMKSGNSKLFVQAVGKPSMANRMPGPVSWSGTCSN